MASLKFYAKIFVNITLCKKISYNHLILNQFLIEFLRNSFLTEVFKCLTFFVQGDLYFNDKEHGKLNFPCFLQTVFFKISNFLRIPMKMPKLAMLRLTRPFSAI